MTDGWTPATKQKVQQAIAAEMERTDAAYWSSLAPLLVDPYQVSIERFGLTERVFVVAKRSARVVFFNDIEEDFATATEADGTLTDCTDLGSLPVALNELASGR